MWLIRSPFRFGEPVFRTLFEDFWHVNPNSANGLDASRSKEVFVQHYDQIRALVPKERLLEYRVQEGWEPLCKFLGKDIPAAEFPRGNEKHDLAERINAFTRSQSKLLLQRIAQIVGVVVVAWSIKRLPMFHQ